MKSVVEVQNISKRYSIRGNNNGFLLRDTIAGVIKDPLGILKRSSRDTFWALKKVTFDVAPGEILGIIGRNGAGKSTLLKILGRITLPTSGQAVLRGRVNSLLEVGTGFHPELTGRENIFLNGTILGMGRKEIKEKLEEIIDFSGVEKFLDMPIKHYSSGMHTRLAFAVAAFLEPEILLVDEILAVGDAEFQKKSMGKISDVAKQGRAIIFVSHDLNAIKNLCHRAILLENGKIKKNDNSSKVIDYYLGMSNKNIVEFKNKFVKKASIRQIKDKIYLEVRVDLPRYFDLPCLGFVISDNLGRPLFGSNPLYSNSQRKIKPMKLGEIIVVLKSPKLLDGTYYLSLWFGDGKEEIFHARECLSFNVSDMIMSRQLPSMNVGPISPECEWTFKND